MIAAASLVVVAGLFAVTRDDSPGTESAGGPTTTAATGEGEGEGTTGTTVSPANATTVPPSTTTTLPPAPASAERRLTEIKEITATEETGPLSPKSIVASGDGVVMAQNMIYNHSVTMFDADGNHVATIPDSVDLAAFGITGYPAGTVQGGPVELAFSADRTKAYTSNYSMYGPGFSKEGHDTCSPSSDVDPSFVYRIDVASHAIDQVIAVGKVPKYVATTHDGKYVLVSNWCTYDLSVIDVASGREVQRLPIGPYPRGIVVSPDSARAYVAVMGGTEIKVVDLATFAVSSLGSVGRGPVTWSSAPTAPSSTPPSTRTARSPRSTPPPARSSAPWPRVRSPAAWTSPPTASRSTSSTTSRRRCRR